MFLTILTLNRTKRLTFTTEAQCSYQVRNKRLIVIQFNFMPQWVRYFFFVTRTLTFGCNWTSHSAWTKGFQFTSVE